MAIRFTDWRRKSTITRSRACIWFRDKFCDGIACCYSRIQSSLSHCFLCQPEWCLRVKLLVRTCREGPLLFVSCDTCAQANLTQRSKKHQSSQTSVSLPSVHSNSIGGKLNENELLEEVSRMLLVHEPFENSEITRALQNFFSEVMAVENP